MSRFEASRAEVGNRVLLDGRLALFHKREHWLAVADLHYGYELSQRAAGNLFPLWGMQTIQARLEELINDYHPTKLILLGDLVHDRNAASSLAVLLKRLQQIVPIVLISGNHDRELGKDFDLLSSWQNDGFCFHHGHGMIQKRSEVHVIGHYHPAGVVRDGAGLRLRLPAFVQQDFLWIMPAFSPWAAGTEWSQTESARVWLCSPERVFRVDDNGRIDSARVSGEATEYRR